MENRTKPSHSPRPLPRGEGERANASSRFGECRLRSHAPKLGAKAARRSPTRPNALAHSALPDEPSGSPSPLGRGRGEGEGISLSFTAFFSAVGSGLNSTEPLTPRSGVKPVKGCKLFFTRSLAEQCDQIANLIVDIFRSRHRVRDLLPQNLAMPAPQAMHR